MAVDAAVEVRVEDGCIVIEAVAPAVYNLATLLAGGDAGELPCGDRLGAGCGRGNRGLSQVYVPEEGDIVWLSLPPQAGREQAGHRPAVVLSPAAYNRATGLMFCCPVTTRVKGYPFEVALSGDVRSVALADHARSVDWRARGAVFKGRARAAELAEIRAKLRAVTG